MQKECFKCHQILPLDEFYRHPQMRDGHLNKCKECTRCDTTQNRRRNVDHYRAYDRARSVLPQRQEKLRERLHRENAEEPEKMKARWTASNALRDGRLRREPCYFCGADEDLEMHHPDYTKPLRIYWLCRICHRKLDGMTKIGITPTREATMQLED